MNFKVLLADDSLTIQKVIKITLANLPYEIVEASSEDALLEKLPDLKPHLVLLDFNLSDRFTGYELTLKIKSISPQSKVLLLLGTFDTIDEQSMIKSGASDKIVKPFDSNKFISICKSLISSFDMEELPYPEVIPPINSSNIIDKDEEHWTMGDANKLKLEKSEITSSELNKSQNKLPNQLIEDANDWGMIVPEVIGDPLEGLQLLDIPPVITVDSENSFRGSLDETKPIKLELEGQIDNQDHVKKIQELIEDEVAQDLWVVDEFEDLKNDLTSKIENSKPNFQPTRKDFDESLFRPIDDNNSISWNDLGAEEIIKPGHQIENFSTFDLDKLKREIEPILKDFIKQYLDEMFTKQTEKIAWEVIPDLAENLIKQELSKMSNQVLKDPES